MLNMNDKAVVGKEFQFYLLFDFIKVFSLDEAIKRKERLLKHNPSSWEQETQNIYLITALYEEIRKDGSVVYSDISKEKVA